MASTPQTSFKPRARSTYVLCIIAIRLTLWFVMVAVCSVGVQFSKEIMHMVHRERESFKDLSLEETTHFIIAYLVLGIYFILIDGKTNSRPLSTFITIKDLPWEYF